MRTLKFIVSGQMIEPDTACDFTGITKGTKGYLQAEFSFDSEWNHCRKAAIFTKLGKEYPVPIVNGKCEIPEEALTWNNFSVAVVGERKEYRIRTNKAEVTQNG